MAKMDKVKFLSAVEAPSLNITGDLTVQGESKISSLETVVTEQNTIKLRDNATSGLMSNEYTGIIAEKYDGTNNGMLVFDSEGTAYVGDEGDLQPLATRASEDNMQDGKPIIWNDSKKRLETLNGEVPFIIEFGDTESGNALMDAYNKNRPIFVNMGEGTLLSLSHFSPETNIGAGCTMTFKSITIDIDAFLVIYANIKGNKITWSDEESFDIIKLITEDNINDYTNAYTIDEKNKLAGIAAGAEVNVQSDWNQQSSTADDYIKNKIPLKNGTGTGSVVFFDGNATGQYSIAGGTTDKTIIENLVGSTLANFVKLEAPTASAGMSMSFGVNNKSTTTGSVTLGVSDTTGVTGYYWDSITFGTNEDTITLSTTRRSSTKTNPSYPTTIDWKKDDIISIINGNRYSACAIIKSVSGNTITVTKLPFTEISYSALPIINTFSYTTPDDRTIYAVHADSVDSSSSSSRYTLRTGVVTLGFGAIAIGAMNAATGMISMATGYNNWSAGDFAHSEGKTNIAGGFASHAEGFRNNATGVAAHAGGVENTASATASMASGKGNTVSGHSGFVSGQSNTVSGIVSAGFGISNTVSGFASLATGNTNKATADDTFAGGYNSEATNTAALAYGHTLKANGYVSTAFGKENTVDGYGSLVSGQGNTVSGSHSLSTGQGNTINGSYSLVSGNENTIDGSHALVSGKGNSATGSFVSVSGKDNTATGSYVLISGIGNSATNTGAIVGGESNTAAYCSLAIGRENEATGDDTLVSGYKSKATNTASVACGHTINVSGYASAAFGKENTVSGTNTLVSGQGNTVSASHTFVSGKGNINVTGNYSIVAGTNHKEISGTNATAFGDQQTVTKAYATAIGLLNKANGFASLVMGNQCETFGDDSFAGGYISKARGNYSLAFGGNLTTDDGVSGQVVLGKWNKSNPSARFIIANGSTDSDRKNIFEVIDSSGKISLKIGNTAISEDELIELKQLLIGATISYNSTTNTVTFS